jgi:predicted nucleotidyltransferase
VAIIMNARQRLEYMKRYKWERVHRMVLVVWMHMENGA